MDTIPLERKHLQGFFAMAVRYFKSAQILTCCLSEMLLGSKTYIIKPERIIK